MGCARSSLTSRHLDEIEFTGQPYRDTSDTKFADLLKQECLAVVRSSYFENCLSRGECFEDRASIPRQCFFSGEEVAKQWSQHGARFLVILSYSWLSKQHPDPKMFHLRRLVRILKELKAFHKKYQEFNFHSGHREQYCPDDLGVILDFCSLWQNRAEGTNEPDTRTEFQRFQFREGLTEINTPYGNKEITSIKLEAVPPTEARKYDDRGWTLFESTIIDAAEPSEMIFFHHPDCLAVWGQLNNLSFGDEFHPDTEAAHDIEFVHKFCARVRRPPLTPQRFKEAMAVRRARAQDKSKSLFTNGKDQPFVLEKYATSFQQLIKTKRFELIGESGWGFDEMKHCAEFLACCHGLEHIRLESFRIAPRGAEALASALLGLANLRSLLLINTGIGNGMKHLLVALTGLTKLGKLSLAGNSLTGDDLASFPCLASLEDLELHGNSIESFGIDMICPSLSGLTQLKKLVIGSNPFCEMEDAPESLSKLKAAVASGCRVVENWND